jgi:hypothetical protein
LAAHRAFIALLILAFAAADMVNFFAGFAADCPFTLAPRARAPAAILALASGDIVLFFGLASATCPFAFAHRALPGEVSP